MSQGSPLQRYQADVQRRGFHADAAQAAAVGHTERLYQQLINTPWRPPGLWPAWLRRPLTPPTGLYFWGGVGRGKTYLLDSFFEALPFAEKRRLHFHAFMLETHAQLRDLPKIPDPLQIVAERMAPRLRVLCLDEFHVHDIADAMLLAGLLRALFNRGVTLVTSSNIPIERLYENGLQRERFLPAMALLQSHTEAVHLAGEVDYRRLLIESAGAYCVEPVGTARAGMRARFLALAPAVAEFDTHIAVNGRPIEVAGIADDVAWFDFAAICQTPRSTGDYLLLAQRFHTLLIGGIPVLTADQDGAARRFVNLVDTLYDHQVKLVISAASPPEQLYGGRQLADAFVRTASRLREMASHRYLGLPHKP